jgi:uncharacterized membrane protein YphA (DoxX/SURF4 family)
MEDESRLRKPRYSSIETTRLAFWRKAMATTRSQSLTERAILLIRILVGWVFVSEGIQKFLFPAALGVGRFTKIGIPYPHFSAPFVGAIEILCGALLLIGFLTRWAAIPLLAVISVAIATTKIPMLAKTGWWSMLHEARVDFSMVLGLLFLLVVGAGTFSLDHRRD